MNPLRILRIEQPTDHDYLLVDPNTDDFHNLIALSPESSEVLPVAFERWGPSFAALPLMKEFFSTQIEGRLTPEQISLAGQICTILETPFDEIVEAEHDTTPDGPLHENHP